MLLILAITAGLILTQPAVIDGDTLRDGPERYRIENLDAPELGARVGCPSPAAPAKPRSPPPPATRSVA